MNALPEFQGDRLSASRIFQNSNCPIYRVQINITAEGCTFFRVHFVDVNGSGRHSVHTVVWLSFRKIGVALLVESTGVVSLSSGVSFDKGLGCLLFCKVIQIKYNFR